MEVGRIVKPHGIRGQVVVDLVSNRPDLRMIPGAVLHSERGRMEVVAASSHQGRWIVTFEGVTDRSQAEGLRGLRLEAEGVEEEGTLWVHELIGAGVVDTSGRRHGVVHAVEANPASDLLVLGDGRLVPLAFVVSHEVGGDVVVDPPPGLLD